MRGGKIRGFFAGAQNDKRKARGMTEREMQSGGECGKRRILRGQRENDK